MAGFFQAINDAARGAACSIIGGTAFIDGFLRDIGTPGTGAYQDRTRALRRQLCNDSDDVVPLPQPPFTGGQCEDVFYQIRWDGEELQRLVCGQSATTQTITANRSLGLYGPLSNYRTEGDVDGNCGPTRQRAFITGAFPQGSAPREFQLISSATGNSNVTYQSLSLINFRIERDDGQPDTCGDPEGPGIPPYSPTTITVNIEYENNQETTTNENVDITIFAPQVNLIGGIFAPITIAGNTFNLVGTVELTPEFKLNISPQINVSYGNGNTDDPIPDPDGEFPRPAVDPAERRVIVGAVVTATSVSNRVDFLPQAGNPDVGIPNLGLVSFYVSTPNGTAWTSDIPVKNIRTYIACPTSGGATDVTGTPRAGVQFDVQPVWGYPGQNLPT